MFWYLQRPVHLFEDAREHFVVRLASGVGFGVWILGFGVGVRGLEFGVWGVGCGARGLGFGGLG